MKLITRTEAIASGLKHYFTGKLCKNGHLDVRTVSKCECVSCAKVNSQRAEAKRPDRREEMAVYRSENKDRINSYQNNYRKLNRDKLREWHRLHYAKNVDRKKAYRRLYYLENKASCNAANKRYREEHREELNEYARQYYADNRDQLVAEKAAYRKENPEKILEANRKWREANPDLLKANWARRRHLARARMKAMCELTQLVTEEAVMLCRERYEETGVKWHLDHMLPLRSKTVSGLHVWNNLQVIPEKMNTEKHNSLTLTEPGEWFK